MAGAPFASCERVYRGTAHAAKAFGGRARPARRWVRRQHTHRSGRASAADLSHHDRRMGRHRSVSLDYVSS
jgi:hypothetical protein